MVVFVTCCVLTVIYRIRLISIGFIGLYKFEAYLSKTRRSMFFSPVFLIFCICCFSGSFLNWVFISGFTHFFSGLELVAGAFVIFIGLLVFNLLGISYRLRSFFGGMGFLRWLRNGGISS